MKIIYYHFLNLNGEASPRMAVPLIGKRDFRLRLGAFVLGAFLFGGRDLAGAPTDFAAEIERDLAKEKPAAAVGEKTANQAVKAAAATEAASGGGRLIDRASVPGLFVVGDLTSEQVIQSPDVAKEHILNVREVEFGFFAPVDQLAQANISLAAHNENGKLFAELHELFLDFPSLPRRLFLRMGRMFPDVGLLNSMHTHSRPFTDAPMVHAGLFGDEGTIDTGGEISWLFPWSFFQEIKFGVFNGRTFGHAHNDGINKPLPLLTSRLKQFFPLGGPWGLQVGFTAMHYSPSARAGDSQVTLGSDFLLKRATGKRDNFALGGEYWYQRNDQAGYRAGDASGFYVYGEIQPVQQWKLGARFDYYARLDAYSAARDLTYTSAQNGQSVFVTYVPSEFSYFRGTLGRADLYLTPQDDYRVTLQADFTIGYHPPHKW